MADLSNDNPERIKGSPRPKQYPKERTAPRTALDSWKARVWTAANAGPIHGVQPIPNNTPSRVDRNELYVDIAIEPVKAVEFIFIPIRLKNTGEIASGNVAAASTV